MILLDTSVWIDNLRQSDAQVVALLQADFVLVHPFVIGELACGNLKSRADILGLLNTLPQARVALEHEVLFFIDSHKLMGLGISYIDAHLLAATALIEGAKLWPRDKRLYMLTQQLGWAYKRTAH